MIRAGIPAAAGLAGPGVVVIAFAYLCFTVLAPWQLGKNTKTSRENSQIDDSLTAEPVPVTTLLPQQDSSAPDAQWRRVTATGRYLPDAQVLARLRVIEGEPAFEVLVPFAVDGGPTVLVDRGYVQPEQGSRVPAIAPPPTDTVTITARLRDSEPAPEGKAPFRQDGSAAGVLDQHRAGRDSSPGCRWPGRICSWWRTSRAVSASIGLPHLDAGPFLSYGIQWIAFGIVAPIGLGYFVVSEIRARRREKAAAAESAARPPTHHRGETRRPLRPSGADRRRDSTARREPARSATAAPPGAGRRCRGAWPVTEGGPDLQLVAVLGRAAEPHAQRPGEGRLDDAGVRAGVSGGVAAPGPQRPGR